MDSNAVQANYWNTVADEITESDAEEKDLVGYHSPYDVFVRRVALRLLDWAQPKITIGTVAELGSGTGLNLRYFAERGAKKLLAFDCASHLLALAQKNLADVEGAQFILTSGSDLPVPEGADIDVLYTLTVLQHIVDEKMLQDVAQGMLASGAKRILIMEDVRAPLRQPSEYYVQREPAFYEQMFAQQGYRLAEQKYISLSWAARFFGVLNRMSGLYAKHEGAQTPRWAFALGKLFTPFARVLDAVLPDRFGMSAQLFVRD